MAIFSRRRQAPRIAPELDDVPLGRLLKGISATRGAGPQDIAIAQMERLLRDTGDDWDRRCHRVSVLAHAAPGLARGWRARQPHHPDALVLSAWSDLASDPWAVVSTCRAAADAYPADPTPWVAALAALRALGRTWAELGGVWQEVRSRDPWHREAHLQILGYLSPEEHGSQVALRDFLDDLIAVMPPQAPTACVPLTAAVQQYHRDLDKSGIESLGVGRFWAQPHVTPVLDHATQNWTRPGYLMHAGTVADLGLLAYCLSRSGRGSESTSTYAMIDGLITEWPWNHGGDPLERFAYWSRG